MIWAIIGAVVAIIIIFLNIPIVLQFKADDKTDFSIKFLFFKIYPLKPKNIKNKGKKKSKKPNYLEKLIEKKGFKSAVDEIISYLKIIFNALKGVHKKIKIDSFDCRITVATNDAAETAIAYGAVCAAVYSLMGFLSSVINFNYKDIIINSNFDNDKYDLYLFFKLKIKIFHIITIIIKMLFDLIKNKKEVLSNERK